jgi:hypothetical protein
MMLSKMGMKLSGELRLGSNEKRHLPKFYKNSVSSVPLW